MRSVLLSVVCIVSVEEEPCKVCVCVIDQCSVYC
jgi:hypothetical protein